ncbi:sodium channel protein Nach-like [Anticarsia gemmatalis]|uniref:sodium channel protein Nach-like n=1 Tax=Anticarsia gemmatalis TaxID=129554 RepID=UPI003F759E87
MPSRKVIASIVVSKFKSFCKHSTLHGVYYFYKASSWFIHLLWVLIIALSMGLCCFLGHMIWEKYVIDPTLTVVETTHYPMIKIEFPAVTVCDSEKVFMPKTAEINALLLLRGFNQSEINEFYKSFRDVMYQDYQPEPYVKKMHSVLEDLGYSLNVLLEMFKRPCSDMIIECNWRSRPYNCSDMFRPVHTLAGHCCQFDIPYFKENNDIQANYISGMDSSEALDIVVMRPLELVDPEETHGYAVMYVFDRKDKITLIDSFISLTPESYFDVNVYTWAIDSSDNVKALPLASRKCILDNDLKSVGGFYQDCLSRLILRRVADYCRCLPFDFTFDELGVEEYSPCNWERHICVHQAIGKVQGDIKDIITNSECYQRCDYVQYDNEVEFLKHQRHLNKLSQHTSRVQVHFGQMTCMKYRREILYTWDQMLANLGGIFGLCLGGSIISVIEIFWFIFELIFAISAAYCKKPVAPKEEKNKVFIVSQRDMAGKLTGKIIVDGKYQFMN